MVEILAEMVSRLDSPGEATPTIDNQQTIFKFSSIALGLNAIESNKQDRIDMK
ncbi:hypothetical protein [Chamaesiphon sp. VAR_48_metabat_135_sub]|uniref:hypothetical protein n=1 Tax=Chamaesiphon sp. VAR_48_metabat_135_sub TaxID=2964699 RepID=UPI00286BB314|nr:hypothetical protein [Chamaesiphon sp. VAR_48_metabat_135_sub]